MSLPPHDLVVDTAGIERLAARLEAAPWAALDTESNSYFAYRERVCLLTFNVADELVIVDPLRFAATPEAFEALRQVLGDPARRLLLHGAEYDVACLKRDYDIQLRGIWDTQQAASMIGVSRTGYGNLVQDLLGVNLPKEHSRYDWGRRPIEREALRYALDDVVYLPPLAERLEAAVRDADLVEEVAVACRAVEEAAAHDGEFDPQKMYRIKEARDLTPGQLSLLTALYRWRDACARDADRPPGRYLAHGALVQLARLAPTSREALRRVKLPGALRGRTDSLLETVRGALADPPAPPPRPAGRGRPEPDVKDRARRLKDWRRKEAQARGVPEQAVLPGRALDHLAEHGAADLEVVPQLGDKRIRLYGDRLRELAR